MQDEFNEEELKNENLNKRAQYTDLNDAQEEAVKLIRFMFSEIYNTLDMTQIESREMSIAYTKLEEAQMWAIKAISRADDIELDDK